MRAARGAARRRCYPFRDGAHIGKIWGVDAAVSTLPLFRYNPGSAAMPPHVDHMPDGRISDVSNILHLSGAPAGHGRTLFPALGIEVDPKPGALLSWRNTDAAGRPLADAAHAVEPLPASARAPRVSNQLALLRGARGEASRAMPVHFGTGSPQPPIPSPRPPPPPIPPLPQQLPPFAPPSPSSHPSQPGICPGDVVIFDDDSYAAAALCTSITGDLSILAFNGSLTLPLLGSVSRDFLVRDSRNLLTGLDMPMLVWVGIFSVSAQRGQIANTQLVSVRLPLLRFVANNFFISGSIPATPNINPTLAYLDVPQLASVGFGFFVYATLLAALDLPSLVSVNSFVVGDNSQLTTMGVALLGSAGEVGLTRNPRAAIDMPFLGSVTGDFRVRFNGFASLDVPLLSYVGSLDVQVNTNITSLYFPSLCSVPALFLVEDNPFLL